MKKIGLLLIFTLCATTVCAQDIRDMHSNKASKVKITDSGNYFVATNVEDALQAMMDGTAKYDFIEIGDANTYLFKDADGNIDIVDAVTGTKSLAQLAAAGSGDVAGPAASTDNAIVRFDGTTGKILQNSVIIINNSNELILPFDNDPVTPILGFGDGDSGFYEQADDILGVAIAGALNYLFEDGRIHTSRAAGFALMDEAPSATNPVFSFDVDFDTGMSTAGADLLSLITGGVEAIRIDDSQNVGFGTTSPDGDLEVEKTKAGGNVNILVDNLATGNTASNAHVQVTTTTTGGDPSFVLGITGQQNWSIGVDNSEANDPFKIGSNSSVGTSTWVTVTIAGATTFGGTVTATTTIFTPQVTLTDEDAAPDAVGEFKYDNTVTGLLDGALCWYDDDAVRYLVDLATLPSDDDYVVAYDAVADEFYMKQDADSGGATALDDVADPSAATSISLDDTETVTLSTTQNTAGSVLTIDNTTADVTNNVYLLELKYTDDGQANADFLKCADNNGDVKLTIQEEGNISTVGTIEGGTLTEGGNAVYNSTEVPGGELGGTWAAPTIDDSVAVTGWDLTTPTITTSLTTSTPTTLSVAELDRLDGLTSPIIDDDKIDTFAELDTIVADKALVNKADGAVWLGVHDYGGATSVEIPNGADPTTDAAGEIAIDTSSPAAYGGIEIYAATGSALIPAIKTLHKTIIDPDGIQTTEDAIPLMRVETEWAPHGITVLDIFLSADAANSGTYVIEEWTDPTTWGSDIESCVFSASTEFEDDGTLADSAVAAGNYIFIDFDTTALNFLNVTITYIINPGN